MTRDEMFDEVIYKFGFESPFTISFAKALDEDDDENLKALFKNLMERSIEKD